MDNVNKKNQKTTHIQEECNELILPVRDALEILGGKWKLQIIIALNQGITRFSEISRAIPGISDRMLSKELKELECNQLVKRTLYDSFPPLVEYTITKHGESLEGVIHSLKDWGLHHRKMIMNR